MLVFIISYYMVFVFKFKCVSYENIVIYLLKELLGNVKKKQINPHIYVCLMKSSGQTTTTHIDDYLSKVLTLYRLKLCTKIYNENDFVQFNFLVEVTAAYLTTTRITYMYVVVVKN